MEDVMPADRFAGSSIARTGAEPRRIAAAIAAYSAFILSFTFTVATVFGLLP
jgi:hypothetical protein